MGCGGAGKLVIIQKSTSVGTATAKSVKSEGTLQTGSPSKKPPHNYLTCFGFEAKGCRKCVPGKREILPWARMGAVRKFPYPCHRMFSHSVKRCISEE